MEAMDETSNSPSNYQDHELSNEADDIQMEEIISQAYISPPSETQDSHRRSTEAPTHSNDEETTRQGDDEDTQDADRSASLNYVEYTGEGGSSVQGTPREASTDPTTAGGVAASTSATAPRREKLICPVDSTLWMSELMDNWDQEFISKAFESFGYTPKNIKIISDKVSDKVKGRPYAFVEFDTAEIAKKAILKANGRSVPGDPERHKFRLSFANLPNQILYEYCIHVSNLSSTVDDAALFKLFGTKYVSCRGAKVHVNPDGSTKRSGIVKFSNQTDQQLALVEMNKYSFKGREMVLRLGATKQRGPKTLLSSLQNPMLAQPGVYGQAPPGYQMFPSGSGQLAPFGQPSVYNPYSSRDRDDYRSRDRSDDRSRRSRSRDRYTRDRYGRGRDRSPSYRKRRSRSRDRKRRAKDLDDYVASKRSKELFNPTFFPTYVQDNKPWSPEEYNEVLIDSNEEWFTSIESAKWSDFYVASNWKQEDLVKQLYPETLIDA